MLDVDGNEILSMMVYQSEIILQLAIHSFKLLCEEYLLLISWLKLEELGLTYRVLSVIEANRILYSSLSRGQKYSSTASNPITKQRFRRPINTGA